MNINARLRPEKHAEYGRGIGRFEVLLFVPKGLSILLDENRCYTNVMDGYHAELVRGCLLLLAGNVYLWRKFLVARFTEQLSAPPVCRTYWTRGQILYKIRRKLVENSLSSYYA